VRMPRTLKFFGLVGLLTGTPSCGSALLNQTASLGGDAAGQRGVLRVIVINNTEFRPVMTFGVFDQFDRERGPDVVQIRLNEGPITLPPDGQSATLGVECGRVFSICGDELIERIEETGLAELDEGALVSGVQFYPAADDVDPDAAPEPVGSAAPFEGLLGVDFPCGAQLIFRLEINDPGPEPFRIDFELIPANSSR